ncbi:unnamed protein product [Lymnaea stagnalis]|uniref:Nuclear pore complex protein Nup88 n=1 Tax=Lymnaea stagnalis TaxID=6523 RepID=A0AAV2HTP5_LYMST
MKSCSWRDQLNNHPITKLLKAKNQSNKQNTESKNTFCSFGSDLYIWDGSEGRILHCNLKTLRNTASPAKQQGKDSEINVKTELGNQIDDAPQYQKLLLNDGFTLDVEAISINQCGSYIAIWGAHGIRVLELPRRWGKNGVFEGGKESIFCKTYSIGERTFSRLKSLQIRHVTWHPGSRTDSHLALLTSDNMLSVYSIHEPNQPISVINIDTGDLSFTHSTSKLFVGPALGETGVAFDFGSAVTIRPKQRAFQSSSSVSSLEVWPVYVVRGNGDVMLLYSHVSDIRQMKFPVQGPLAMNPPAEDNYGVDACSILCLPTPFPVIVISTCDGRLHHCVQLPGEDSDLDQSNTSSVSKGEATLYESIPEPSLYVIETAVLELCLSVPRFEGDSVVEDEFMCPVLLKKDGISYDRYHCAHAAGVHSVALPWVSAVQQFFLDDTGELNMPDDKECIVEHLVCTKPVYSCPNSPILGMDIITDPLLGTTLLVLSCDYEFTAIPIGIQYQLGLISTNKDDQSEVKSQPMAREEFSQQVKQILQKRTSVPLLKAGSSTELSQQDCFQLLSRATQVLREEYFQRQDHARQEIDNRIKILHDLKEHQLQDIKHLSESRVTLQEHARSIAEKLETCKENHENLTQRVEAILKKVGNRVPKLSDAERQLRKELNKIEDNIEIYQQNIEQVRTKQQVQEKQIAKTAKSGGSIMQKRQLTQIHDVLKDEGDEIEDLKKEVSRLNIALN